MVGDARAAADGAMSESVIRGLSFVARARDVGGRWPVQRPRGAGRARQPVGVLVLYRIATGLSRPSARPGGGGTVAAELSGRSGWLVEGPLVASVGLPPAMAPAASPDGDGGQLAGARPMGGNTARSRRPMARPSACCSVSRLGAVESLTAPRLPRPGRQLVEQLAGLLGLNWISGARWLGRGGGGDVGHAGHHPSFARCPCGRQELTGLSLSRRARPVSDSASPGWGPPVRDVARDRARAQAAARGDWRAARLRVPAASVSCHGLPLKKHGHAQRGDLRACHRPPGSQAQRPCSCGGSCRMRPSACSTARGAPAGQVQQDRVSMPWSTRGPIADGLERAGAPGRLPMPWAFGGRLAPVAADRSWSWR